MLGDSKLPCGIEVLKIEFEVPLIVGAVDKSIEELISGLCVRMI
jgi:hypothetical protein